MEDKKESKYNSRKFDIGVLGQGSSKSDEIKMPAKKEKLSDKNTNEVLSNVIGKKVKEEDFSVPKQNESITKPTTHKKLDMCELVKETEQIAKEMLKEGKHRRK